DGGVVEADEMSHELLPPAPPHLREGPQGERVRDADERIDATGEEARGRLGAVLETVLDPFDEIAGKTESAAGAEVAVKAVVARARALRPAEEADAGGALGGEGADGVIGPGAAVDVDPVVDLGGRGVLAPPGTPEGDEGDRVLAKPVAAEVAVIGTGEQEAIECVGGAQLLVGSDLGGVV